MRRGHFEALSPCCPICRAAGADSPLTLAAGDGEPLLEGILACPAETCRREYPVIDGLPLLVGPIREYVGNHLPQILARDDLSPSIESLIGDCAGPGSSFDTVRQHLSTYGRSHWGEEPAGVVALLDAVLERLGPVPAGPALDVGCAVGRSTFELARRLGHRTLGVDLHHAMLRVAARALHEGRAVYPERRVGLVYERREVPVGPDDRVDFWAADATALPFSDAAFALVVSLNVLDCVRSPRDHLAETARVLVPGGRAIVTTPYDWSPNATPVEAWLGGHSQRGPWQGAAEPVLEALLTSGAHPSAVSGLRIVERLPVVPWRLATHDRSAVEYSVHMLVVEKTNRAHTAAPA